jgi:3-dehydroquinate dehydratase-2
VQQAPEGRIRTPPEGSEALMPTRDILVLNGPNLGALGRRQTEIYGRGTLEDLRRLMTSFLQERAPEARLDFYQSNSEGGLIDRLEQAGEDGASGLILNAGALTHTSLALADCLAWIGIPCVEVHISNILARPEPIRHSSLIAHACTGVISGFGLYSYVLALQALLHHLEGP